MTCASPGTIQRRQALAVRLSFGSDDAGALEALIEAAAATPTRVTGPPGGTAVSRPAPAERSTRQFWTDLPGFSRFDDVADHACFEPLPEGWVIGVADVVASTDLIAAGRYRRVNTAGAAVISALSNALGHLDFPFMFTGDGARFAVAGADAAAAADALAATVAWVGDALEFRLRGATLAVGAVREAGYDVRVGRFAASPHAAYAMFAGGGLAWAEERLKAGTLATVPEQPNAKPNLAGLSCRFQVQGARHGLILSVLVQPAGSGEAPEFRRLTRDILAIADGGTDNGRPLPRFEPLAALAVEPTRIQARLHRRPGERMAASWARSVAGTLAAVLILGAGLKLGSFSPRRYMRDLVQNSDFRKYDDGLMMTLDCSTALADAIETRLHRAEAEGHARFGLHRQDSATVTCVVPSASQPNHVHFIDGAAGGYAEAARALKARAASVAHA